MKFISYILFSIFFNLLVFIHSNYESREKLLYEISNTIETENNLKIIIKNFFNLKDEEEELPDIIMEFVNNYTNIKGDLFTEFQECLKDLTEGENHGVKNFLSMIGFSGKGLSDLGLIEECVNNDLLYYLVTYEYTNESFVGFVDETDILYFFQQKTFYTGLCLSQTCNRVLNFLFNETVDSKFYDFIKREMYVEKAKIYDVRKSNHTKDPTPTYENNGTYNAEKTKNEKSKFNIFKISRIIVITILSIQFFISVIFNLCYKPYKKASQLRSEIEKEEKEAFPQEFEEKKNEQIFNIADNIEKENNCCKGCFCEFLFNYFSAFNNIKILLQKKNQYYNSNNLEIITFIRIICMVLITFINNFEVLIKIPSKDFFYEDFYKKYTFIILKFASFGVDMWICLDGFESMYKLISYYKKYVFSKNKSTISFGGILSFYLYSFYKIIAFAFLFFLVNYFNKYFIYYKSDGALFEYYSNHIYNDKLDTKEFLLFLIPGYSFYYSYYLKCSIFEDLIISKFSLLIINEFQIYTIFIIIFYMSNLLKSDIFDYLIIIINTILYLLNFWICQFKDGENTYYSYKLVLDNFLTIRYPHIIFNYFFLGAMAALTCFYFQDSFSSNSITNSEEKYPFTFCYSIIKIFNYLNQNGKFIWIIIILILQIIICFSFNIIIKINNNCIYIPFNTGEKMVLCYETGIFLLLFCFLLIFFNFNRNENENQSEDHSSLLILMERTNFSFLFTINLLLYSYYCYFNFQLKLNYQNLWIITFGLFLFACSENLIFTLAFVFLFKITNKKIIRYFLPSEVKRISIPSELLNRSAEEFK